MAPRFLKTCQLTLVSQSHVLLPCARVWALLLSVSPAWFPPDDQGRHHQAQWPCFWPLLPGLTAALTDSGLTRHPLASPPLELLVSPLLPSRPSHPLPGASHSADTGRLWLLGAPSWTPSFLSLCPVCCVCGVSVTPMVSGVLFIQVASKPSS